MYRKKIIKWLRYLLCIELLWLIVVWLSPWSFYPVITKFAQFTFPWLVLFFLIRFVRCRWEQNHEVLIGCLYSLLWVMVPVLFVIQIFYSWLLMSDSGTTQVTYEDDKYRVTELYGFFTTNSDNVRIEEHWGPFYREVYYGDLYSAHTNTLKSKAAIRRFLERWNKDNSPQ